MQKNPMGLKIALNEEGLRSKIKIDLYHLSADIKYKVQDA